MLHGRDSLPLPLHSWPPLVAGFCVRVRTFAPSPHEVEQAPKVPQLPQAQSTGQACLLQLCASRPVPVHWAPPLADCVATVRFLVEVPLPQLWEHRLNFDQLLHVQSTGHGCELQDSVSLPLPMHGTPPCMAPVATARYLILEPPPHELEQTVKAPHEPQAQSTGQACWLQACELLPLPVQAAPPFAAGVAVRLRSWIPPPQDTEQALKLPQLAQAQSMGHSWLLQVSVSLLLPEHDLPPLASTVTIVRFLMRVPPPHDFEHTPLLQEPQMQSTGQACALQGWLADTLPLQAAPPKACIVMTTRLRVCIPPPQDLEQLPKLDQGPKAQSTGQA